MWGGVSAHLMPVPASRGVGRVCPLSPAAQAWPRICKVPQGLREPWMGQEDLGTEWGMAQGKMDWGVEAGQANTLI